MLHSWQDEDKIILEGFERQVLTDALLAYGPGKVGDHELYLVLLRKLAPDMNWQRAPQEVSK